MKIDISQLKDDVGSSLQWEQKVPVPEHNMPVFEEVLSPLQVEVQATKTNEGVFVAGVLQLSVVMVCNRCLAPFGKQLRSEFSEEYLPAGESADTEFKGEDALFSEDAPRFRGHEIDITDLVHENVWLAVPMKSICSEDCQGICSVCGNVRNERDCQCDRENVDPRLATLKDILKESSNTREEDA